MLRKLLWIFTVLSIALVSTPRPLDAQEPTAGNAPDAVTTIVVDSTDDDYTDGKSKKCVDFPAEPCTLRRAINQAYGLPPGQRPVHIQFNIPNSDAGYDSVLNVWKIELTGSTAYDLRELNGDVIVDGSTQPGGRASGPTIIVDGQMGKNNGFVMRNGNNVVRGLGMQQFKRTHVTMSGDDNLIEDCWFGLSADGRTLSSGDDTIPEGGSAVSLSDGVSGNRLLNNRFAGFVGAAVALRGEENTFAGNRVGTRADGSVPIPARFDVHPCKAGAWTGGSGITVDGTNQIIGGPTAAEGNLFAGLFLEISATSTQGPALKVRGDDRKPGHLIQNNLIGLDTGGRTIGVCGRGIDLGSTPYKMLILDNTIVEPGLSAILINGSNDPLNLNANRLQGNVIRRGSQWPDEQGNNKFAEDAIAYGPVVPSALRTFVPGKITEIDGKSVRGTSGNGSSCPGCTIELFLDDDDAVVEALARLAMVTANASGDWQATLPTALQPDQALRTMSTVPDNFTIDDLRAGTTSNLSSLYREGYLVFLPVVMRP
jgi:hypothetical protein